LKRFEYATDISQTPNRFNNHYAAQPGSREGLRKSAQPLTFTLGVKEPRMKTWILVLKAFAYVWLAAATLLILAGISGVWMKGGFAAVQELLSPFNVVNWFVTVLTLAPGLAALAWANKLTSKLPVAP